MITNYFVQHGVAESKDVDQSRPLSDDGKYLVAKVASRLKDQNIVIGKIHHSGKLRALQTAQIFSEILEVSAISEMSGLNPNDEARKIIDQLKEDAVMYVGHLPNIQKIVSGIITRGGSDPVVKFQNSAVACIEIDQGQGCLKWFITADFC